VKQGYKYLFPQSICMAEQDGCPDCGSAEGFDCPTCCPCIHVEKKNIREGIKGRYLREVIMCKDCGNYEVLQEIDYYMEFPCL